MCYSYSNYTHKESTRRAESRSTLRMYKLAHIYDYYQQYHYSKLNPFINESWGFPAQITERRKLSVIMWQCGKYQKCLPK